VHPILLIYLAFFVSLAFAFVRYRWVPPVHLSVSIALVVALGLAVNWNVGFLLLLLLLPGTCVAGVRLFLQLWPSREDAAPH
jgi:hypothetical protein